MGPVLTRNLFCGKSSQNSSKPVLIFWSSIPYVDYLGIYDNRKCTDIFRDNHPIALCPIIVCRALGNIKCMSPDDDPCVK